MTTRRTLHAVMLSQREVRLATAQHQQEKAAGEFADATIAKLRALPHDQYLRSVHWQAFRAVILKERGRCCEICGQRYGPIDVHHLTYERKGCERREDVIVLCRKHHDEAHAS